MLNVCLETSPEKRGSGFKTSTGCMEPFPFQKCQRRSGPNFPNQPRRAPKYHMEPWRVLSTGQQTTATFHRGLSPSQTTGTDFQQPDVCQQPAWDTMLLAHTNALVPPPGLWSWTHGQITPPQPALTPQTHVGVALWWGQTVSAQRNVRWACPAAPRDTLPFPAGGERGSLALLTSDLHCRNVTCTSTASHSFRSCCVSTGTPLNACPPPDPGCSTCGAAQLLWSC